MPGANDDEQHQPDSRMPVARILLILGGVLLAYVLSVGPVVRLVDRGHLNETHMEALYAPLIALSDRWSLADDFLEWYCDLWRSQ